MESPTPYRYPSEPLKRKHGPDGYSKYGQFRDWLRDEFDFRCVYCLWREQWSHFQGSFQIDHFQPRKIREDLALVYSNLVYACQICNLRKGTKLIPDPEKIAFGDCLQVHANGKIEALNDDGVRLIDKLGLAESKITETRERYIGTILSLYPDKPDLFKGWMGFPKDLPNLKEIKPKPPRNHCPDGLDKSWHAIREQGKLPEYYE